MEKSRSAGKVCVCRITGALTEYFIQFFVPTSGAREGQAVEMNVKLDVSTLDQLRATVAGSDGDLAVTLDRVDSIDPPLASP